MRPKLIELRPDRDLLNPNFNGYKLSLDNIPVLKSELEKEVYKVLLNQNQYSLLHAKLFGLHNHLFTDVYDSSKSVYFVDDSWTVRKVSVNSNTGRFEDIKDVWSIPQCIKIENYYNVSIKFLNEDLVLLSDGYGGLHLLETGSRTENRQWSSLFYENVLDEKPFILIDAVCKAGDKRQIHCVLVSIERDDDKFYSLINWITIEEHNDGWGQMALKVLKGVSFHYVALERNCEFIYIASDKSFKFILDSENPIIEEAKIEPKKVYTWLQTTNDVTVRLNIPGECTKDDFTVNTITNEITVKYKQKVLLEGNIFSPIDSSLTTWNISDGLLEITVVKSETSLIWPEFIVDDDSGEQILDQNLIDEVHQRLAHLCSDNEVISQETGPCFNAEQIEECDFDGDNMAILERLSASNHNVTHRINIGSHQVIMTLNLSHDAAPAIVLRHDVDACIWQPTFQDTWSLKHEGTLYAFGYVQASKEQRKFSSCSTDLSYSVICESMRHIFIYRQNKCVASGELRNRRSGQQVNTVAEQQVVSLNESEILGLSATEDVLYLLTSKSILALKIK